MKKIIACIIIAVFLMTALYGCGNYGDARDNGTYSSVETPTATATVTPNMPMDEDDGIVNDRDGIIDNNDTAGNTGTSGTSGSAGNAGGVGGSSSASGTGSSGSAGSSASGSSNGGSSESSPSVSSGNGNS